MNVCEEYIGLCYYCAQIPIGILCNDDIQTLNNDIVADHATLLFGKRNYDKNKGNKKQIHRIVNYTPEKFIEILNKYNWNCDNKNDVIVL